MSTDRAERLCLRCFTQLWLSSLNIFWTSSLRRFISIWCFACRISHPCLDSIFDYSLSWYLSKEEQLRGAAAQVGEKNQLWGLARGKKKSTIGCCSTGSRFAGASHENCLPKTRISSILPVTRSILQSAVSAVANHDCLSDFDQSNGKDCLSDGACSDESCIR
ncbi:uncharacterized protein LOC116203066 isoform X1 [Punica granatum]|uniref:Uncharacterized protein LOC116203066 isoform X1 n=1 Tax=Punica granatum TaxID=22663 RepID=A0A6P8D0I6_PUNGR|nr:uncharacterized protein LOC116203066 isoform X1 [Punica granatum]